MLLKDCGGLIDDALRRHLLLDRAITAPERELTKAMRHAVLAGGKRLRPFLLMETAGLFDIPPEQSLKAAVALEMLHSYSLVHDDLPAMDNSDLRRGQPTVHRIWNEATAVLVGDALLTEAFALMAAPEIHEDPQVRLDLVAGLSKAAGKLGMVGGQMIDLSPQRRQLDLRGVERLQAMKTGALILFACMAGAIIGQAGEIQKDALHNYATCLGLAFQMVDDLLDGDVSTEEAGKPTGVDGDMDKATFVGLLGRKEARKKAGQLAMDAKSALDIFGPRAQLLKDVADFVLVRRS